MSYNLHMTTTKLCSKCKEEKPVDCFAASKYKKSRGYHYWCNTCQQEPQRQYRINHPEYVARGKKALADRNDLSRNTATAHGDPWSNTEDEFIREFWSTEKVDDIAEALGRTVMAVKGRAKVLKVRKNRKLLYITAETSIVE